MAQPCTPFYLPFSSALLQLNPAPWRQQELAPEFLSSCLQRHLLSFIVCWHEALRALCEDADGELGEERMMVCRTQYSSLAVAIAVASRVLTGVRSRPPLGRPTPLPSDR